MVLLANHVAKTAERKPGSYPAELAQVCNLAALTPPDMEQILRATPVGEVWGVGRRISKQLIDQGVATALDLARMEPAIARRGWSVIFERTVRELRGESCLGLEDIPPNKQEIACTRSFGRPVTQLRKLIEAVSDFSSRAAEKQKKQPAGDHPLASAATRRCRARSRFAAGGAPARVRHRNQAALGRHRFKCRRGNGGRRRDANLRRGGP